MKKTGLGYLAVFVLFVVFSAIAFVLPVNYNYTFWILYSFSAFAILSQISIWHFAFSSTDTLKDKFFASPIASIGVIYLMLQLAVFVRCITIPNFPAWLALVICTALWGLSVLAIIGAQISRGEIINVENKVLNKVAFIKTLEYEIGLLLDKEIDSKIKIELKKLKEAVRFSDPMSADLLSEIEQNIVQKVKDFSNADDKFLIISELNSLLKQRNEKCKILK